MNDYGLWGTSRDTMAVILGQQDNSSCWTMTATICPVSSERQDAYGSSLHLPSRISPVCRQLQQSKCWVHPHEVDKWTTIQKEELVILKPVGRGGPCFQRSRRVSLKTFTRDEILMSDLSDFRKHLQRVWVWQCCHGSSVTCCDNEDTRDQK